MKGWGNPAFWGKKLQIIKCKLRGFTVFRKRKAGLMNQTPTFEIATSFCNEREGMGARMTYWKGKWQRGSGKGNCHGKKIF